MTRRERGLEEEVADWRRKSRKKEKPEIAGIRLEVGAEVERKRTRRRRSLEDEEEEEEEM